MPRSPSFASSFLIFQSWVFSTTSSKSGVARIGLSPLLCASSERILHPLSFALGICMFADHLQILIVHPWPLSVFIFTPNWLLESVRPTGILNSKYTQISSPVSSLISCIFFYINEARSLGITFDFFSSFTSDHQLLLTFFCRELFHPLFTLLPLLQP